MLRRVLLGLLLCVAWGPGLRSAAAGRNPQLCEGYAGPGGRYHAGFRCPRLGEPPALRYCCRPGPGALKSCCGRPGWEAPPGGNRSAPPPAPLRNPRALPVVGLYGLLVLLLVAVDLLHFQRRQRCRPGRLLPRARARPARRPPRGPRAAPALRGAPAPRGGPAPAPAAPRAEG